MPARRRGACPAIPGDIHRTAPGPLAFHRASAGLSRAQQRLADSTSKAATALWFVYGLSSVPSHQNINSAAEQTLDRVGLGEPISGTRVDDFGSNAH